MADEDKQDAQEQGISKKKLILMMVIGAVALSLLVGVTVYFLVKDNAPPPAEESAKKEENQGPADADAEGNPLPILYHHVKPAFLAMLPPASKEKMLQVEVHLMTRHPEMVQFLTDNDPMVKAKILTLLEGQDAEALKGRAGKEKLQADLTALVQKLADEAGVKAKLDNAYFTRLVME